MFTIHYQRLLFVVLVSCFLLTPFVAYTQQNPAGAYVLDGSGIVSTLGSVPVIQGSVNFGFDIAKDIELAQDETGFIVGYYILDGYGGQQEIGAVDSYDTSKKPYWAWDIARDLEIVNTYQLVTSIPFITGQIGYYVMDGFGGIHPVNDDVDASRKDPNNPMFGLQHDNPSYYPPPFNYAYWWAFDIARDLEVSYYFTTVTAGVVGETNGYYVLDGFGAVHNCRVDPFDPSNESYYAPWWNNPDVVALPYFGWDIARDFELTPDGNAYYLLDGYGGVHAPRFASGDIPLVTSAYYEEGFDIARDFEYVQGPDGAVIGYYLLDGLGVIHRAGNVPDLGQLDSVPTATDIYRDLEVSPLYAPIPPAPPSP